MEDRIVKIEVKLEMMEKTLAKTVDILDELTKNEVRQEELERRISKIESIIAKLNWMVIAAVVGAILGLVIDIKFSR